MAHRVTLSAPAEINGELHPKGKSLSVSDSIYNRLKSEGKIAPEKRVVEPNSEDKKEL